MIMAIISVEPVGIPLISSVLCEPKKNYKIGLTVYQKQKRGGKTGSQLSVCYRNRRDLF